MSRVFWDTNLFIYLFEDRGQRGERVAALLERMNERGDELLTSTMTLGEILVRPTSLRRVDAIERYEEGISASASAVVPFDRDCTRIYAEIRQDRSIRPPDAIQLSCASQARCDLFITNDDRLSRKKVPGIQFIVSLERAFL